MSGIAKDAISARTQNPVTYQKNRSSQPAVRDLEAAAKRGGRVGYFRLKRRIHEIEVRASYNPVLSETMRPLHAQSRRFWYTYEPTESFTHGARLHGAIARQVCKRDATAAAKAVAALFAFLERLTRDALERRPLV